MKKYNIVKIINKQTLSSHYIDVKKVQSISVYKESGLWLLCIEVGNTVYKLPYKTEANLNRLLNKLLQVTNFNTFTEL